MKANSKRRAIAYTLIVGVFSAPFLVGIFLALSKGEWQGALWWMPAVLLAWLATYTTYKRHEAEDGLLFSLSQMLNAKQKGTMNDDQMSADYCELDNKPE